MFIRNAAILTLAAFALAGCGRDDVKVYHIVKDDSAAPPLEQNQIATPERNPSEQSQKPQLQWTLPDGWQEKAPGQMRVASFTVTGTNGEVADVGVIPLPTTGQEIELVNMWREQMQLPALTNETVTETVFVGNDPAKLFDIASEVAIIDGKFRARILVAELPRGGTSWFFKMTGEDTFVAAQKENFLQFLKSVSFVENAPAQIAATRRLKAKLANQSGRFRPAGWQLIRARCCSQNFPLPAATPKTDVNVSSFAGDGGGLEANVNRWRGQLGLPAISEILTTSFDVPGGKAIVVDYTGTDSKTGKPARLVGAVVPQNGQTWFYKLMGDETVVAQQKDAFIKFIQSANYANAR